MFIHGKKIIIAQILYFKTIFLALVYMIILFGKYKIGCSFFLDSSKDCVKGFVHSNFNVAQRARMLDILNIIHYEWEEGKWQSTKNWKRNKCQI